MRFRTSKRYRSITWWGVFVCALLLVGSYVVFDLLDLDGSRLSRGPIRDMMIGNTSEATTERFLRTDLAVALSHELLAPLVIFQASTEANRRTLTAIAFSRLRQSHALPRVNLAAEPARGLSQATDPA